METSGSVSSLEEEEATVLADGTRISRKVEKTVATKKIATSASSGSSGFVDLSRLRQTFKSSSAVCDSISALPPHSSQSIVLHSKQTETRLAPVSQAVHASALALIHAEATASVTEDIKNAVQRLQESIQYLPVVDNLAVLLVRSPLTEQPSIDLNVVVAHTSN